jgi:hypothetical protein
MGDKQRGTVLQVPAGGSPGLIFVNGQQFPFQLPRIWQSPVAPTVNQTVDVTFDEAGSLISAVVVDAQALAKERLNQFAGVAGERGQQAVTKGGVVFREVVARMGRMQLIICAVLFLAWFFLPALSVNLGFVGKSFSVSDVLGLDLQSGASFGFWSFLGLVAVVLPWVAPWLQARWASIFFCAPVLMIIVAYARVRWQMHASVARAIDQAGQFGGSEAQSMVQGMVDQMAANVGKAISYDFGLWVVLLLSLYLAFIGIKRYLSAPNLSSATH